MKRKASGQPGSAFKKPRMTRQPSVVLGDVIMADVGRRRKGGAVALQAEKKFFDTSDTTDVTTTATVVNLNAVGAGDTALLRDGNKILCKTIQIRAKLTVEAATANTICRYLVVHDKNANGTAPTAAQVFEGTPAVTSMKNISNASRFTTLLDKVVLMNQQDSGGGNLFKGYISEFVKVPGNLQLTSFADGTAAVPTSGSLSLIIIGDVAAGAADCDAVWANRLRFIG